MRVDQLLAAGFDQASIVRRLGLAKSTVAYHVRVLGGEPDPRFARRYDWAAIQRLVDGGTAAPACRERFGIPKATWYAAIKDGRLAVAAGPSWADRWLVVGARRGGQHLKAGLLRHGLKQPLCEGCGLDSWNGRELVLEVHHRNGTAEDNRLENLVLLCPNCHSQTDTFGGRNRGAAAAARV